MSKVSNTLYVVQTPNGHVLENTASFSHEECMKKFGNIWEVSDPESYCEKWGCKVLEINLPKELDKFND